MCYFMAFLSFFIITLTSCFTSVLGQNIPGLAAKGRGSDGSDRYLGVGIARHRNGIDRGHQARGINHQGERRSSLQVSASSSKRISLFKLIKT